MLETIRYIFLFNIVIIIYLYLVSTTLGSGVIRINVVGDGGDGGGIAASSSSKICKTIASIRAPRARK